MLPTHLTWYLFTTSECSLSFHKWMLNTLVYYVLVMPLKLLKSSVNYRFPQCCPCAKYSPPTSSLSPELQFWGQADGRPRTSNASQDSQGTLTPILHSGSAPNHRKINRNEALNAACVYDLHSVNYPLTVSHSIFQAVMMPSIKNLNCKSTGVYIN